jgi:hypothetical protein
MIEIIQLKPGDINFNLFHNFPEEIYPADSRRIRGKETVNSEYLENCFVLLTAGKVQARAALYNNPHLQYQNKKALCIGNFESVNNKESGQALLQHISSEAKRRGAGFLIGPMNGSTWDSYRFSVHHTYPHFFLEPYHHLYYNEHFTCAGFNTIARYFSSIEKDLKCISPAIAKRENELKQAGITFRNINLNQYEKELEKIFYFNGVAFRSNFLYTPISKEVFIKKYSETKGLIDPGFVILAEDAEGNLIGYFFCINDFYNEKEKSLIVKTVARHPDKKWSGTGHVMANMICRRALQKQYQSIIHSFMYEQGTSVSMSKNFSGTIYKNYVLFGKEL